MLLIVFNQNDFLLVGAEDGRVYKYSLETYEYERYLVECTLPIRDIALSPDGRWAAVTSESVHVPDYQAPPNTDPASQ